MRPKLYLETTIVSYLTAWPSRDLVMAANQETTREWWTKRRGSFDIFISQIVIKEVHAGDKHAAGRRLEVLKQFPLLDIIADTERLAARLIARVPLTKKALADALHISVAAANEMNYLLTWNCTHIANATLRSSIEGVCRSAGFDPPVICTPQEMLDLGDENA